MKEQHMSDIKNKISNNFDTNTCSDNYQLT